jgi:rfaE bifunctional protein kinase chain/domain
VGDIGLDEYVLGQVKRISPEAPVPILEVEKEEWRLGLAANVAQNVVSLGGEAILVSVVGQDNTADQLKELLQSAGINTQNLVTDETRPTTKKTRVMAQHHHLVRVDYEVRKYLSQKSFAVLVQKLKDLMPSCDGVILQDYAKGVISQDMVQKVIEIAHAHGKKVFVDPHRANPAEFYQNADLIKPNYDEAIALSGLNFDDIREVPNKVEKIGNEILQKTKANEVVITRGKEGMSLFSQGQILKVPTFARQVFDVTGAGDTVIAALSLALVAGLSLPESCMLANYAAGFVVGKVGCVPCSMEDLVDYILNTEG